MSVQSMSEQEMLDFALALARRAGRLLRQAYQSGPSEVHSKQTAVNLVTEVDLASERLIKDALGGRFPDHEVYAEESAEGLPGAGSVWLVDPLDGTTNFTHGFPVFAVSLALLQNGRIALGVTYDPLRDEAFWARRGGGAWCNGQRLRVSRTAELGRSLLATGFPYDRASNRDNNLAEFSYFMPRTRGVRRAGAAALDLAWLAAGRLDGYWEKNLQPWDWAAGQVLVEEAGGRVTDYLGQPWALDGWKMVASNSVQSLHDSLVEGIRVARQGLMGAEDAN